MKNKNSFGVVVSENLPVGYRTEKDGVTLEIRKYVMLGKNQTVLRAVCYCNVCGNVVPALEKYTEQNLAEWLDFHIGIFRREHTAEVKRK